MSASTVGLTLLVAYASIIVIKTIRLGREPQTSPSEYFLAGRRLGPWVHMMTITASFFSMYSFAGAYGITWRIGINFLNQGWWMLMFLSWTGIAIGGRLWLLSRRFGFITPADLMAHYYDSEMIRALVAGLGILILFPYAAIQFSGVGKMIESFSDGAVSYEVGVGLFLAFTAAYTLVSGMRGVAWTDLIQGALFGFVMFAALGWVLVELGGPMGVLSTVQRARPELFDFDLGFSWFLNLSITWGLGFAMLPHIWQRWYAADSLATVYRSSWSVGAVSWALCLPIFFIGLSAHVLLPDLTAAESDSLFPILLAEHLPTLGALIVPAAFAAAMSTVDSMLLTLASSIENDVLARVAKNATPERLARAGKGFVIVFALMLVGFALTSFGRDFIVPLGNMSAALALVLLPPLTGPLYWGRGTTRGAIVALVTGGAFMIATLAPEIRHLLLPQSGLFSFPASSGLALTAIVYVSVSLLTEPPPLETRRAYHDYLESALENA